MKTGFSFTKLLFLLLFISTMISTTANAQEVGISPTLMFTDNAEMENPIGIGFYYFQPIGFFGLKFEYFYAGSNRNFMGQLVRNPMAVGTEYPDEDIKSSSSLTTAEISAYVPAFYSLVGNDLNFGMGISFDKFECERTALETGRTANLMAEKKFGTFFILSVSRKDIFSIPLKLELLFQYKHMSNQSETTDIERPFEDLDTTKELQLNIAYYFR